MKAFNRLIGILLMLTLVGCGSSGRAPVEDRRGNSAVKVYQVQRGDTLYSIAFRYGLDYRKVAAANNIPGPYTIYPGQKIYLREGSLPPAIAASVASPPPTKVVATGSTKSTPVKKPVSKPAAETVTPVPSGTAPAAGTYTGKKVSSWRWPTTGRVSRGYSGSVHESVLPGVATGK